jgi:hypothetical protein
MHLKWGWVEIYRGSDPEQYRQIEQILGANQIRYRIFEFGQSNKLLAVSSPITAQSVSRGPSFNPAGAYAEYAEKHDEPTYTIEIRRTDVQLYQAAKSKLD